MTTYLGKSCSFGLPRVPFVNCRQFMYLVNFPFGFEGRIWDLIVSVPDHCLSFYFSYFPFGFEGGMWDLIVSVPDHFVSFYFLLLNKLCCNSAISVLIVSILPETLPRL